MNDLQKQLENARVELTQAVMAKNYLQVKVDSFEQQIKQQKSKVFKPEIGDEAWLLNKCGATTTCEYDSSSTRLDYLLSVGQLWATEQEAIVWRVKQQATVRVLNRLHEIEEGDAVDWGDKNQCKYNPVLKYNKDSLVVWSVGYIQTAPHKWYTTDETAWDKIFEEMPDDVKLMMGVEND